MNENDGLIPIFAIFCTIGLPIMAWMMFRLLKHRERMEMIRHGMAPSERIGTAWVPPPPPQVSEPRKKRKGRGCRDEDNDPPHVTLRKGIRLSMIGLALTIGLSFIGFDGGHPEPGPWLLGGLIPMFVGISQVILALLSGASLYDTTQPWAAAPPPTYGAPPPPAPPGTPMYDTSYTYRPGNQQELQPPAGPPDRR
jgi:hypothetical protein